MSPANRPPTLFTLEQAVEAAPSLAALQQRIRASQQHLALVSHVIPPHLRPHVVAGPVQDTEWCLLVSNAAVSTKLRQLLPALLQVLTQNGAQVSAIRIKVQASRR
jgi:hypothetical protein